MQFEQFVDAHRAFLGAVFALALVMGAVANKTRFCTMGAVSDWINMGDQNRLRSWLLAIAVAMLGMVVFESIGLIDVAQAFPAYRSATLIWAENLLGGLMFGIGMTLAGGCSNRILVRIGGGSFKAVAVFLIIAPVAYFMVTPFPGTDQTLYSWLFYAWLRPLAIDLSTPQDIGSLIAVDYAGSIRLIIGMMLALALLGYCFRSREFRRGMDYVLGGLVFGLVVFAAWLVTSNISVVTGAEETVSLQEYAQQWDFHADSDQGRPADARALAPQSYSFINPMGQTLEYVLRNFGSGYVTFGLMAVTGMILGSLIWALFRRTFRLEWFTSFKDFVAHVCGGILMGLGGILALGCTIGQGISGVSTLALGSLLAFGAMVFGSALTMKVQYYQLVYGEDATLLKALAASLADLKLWPTRLRVLDRV